MTMTLRWEFLDHTADVLLAAYGRDLDELFASAGLGLFDLMVDLDQIEERVARDVVVEGDDLPDLLVAWLNELLYVFEVEGLVFKRFAVVATTTSIRATGHGERLDPARHVVKVGVKAAALHLAEVAPIEDGAEKGWRGQVILDV